MCVVISVMAPTPFFENLDYLRYVWKKISLFYNCENAKKQQTCGRTLLKLIPVVMDLTANKAGVPPGGIIS